MSTAALVPSANPLPEGTELAFADRCSGVVPFSDVPEVNGLPDLVSIQLPSPYQLVLRNSRGEVIDPLWDFARPYCDASYRPRVEAIAAAGRQSFGSRIRQLREAAGMTREELAASAGIGRDVGCRRQNHTETLLLSRAFPGPA